VWLKWEEEEEVLLDCPLLGVRDIHLLGHPLGNSRKKKDSMTALFGGPDGMQVVALTHIIIIIISLSPSYLHTHMPF
jgi:hypothetical protein